MIGKAVVVSNTAYLRILRERFGKQFASKLQDKFFAERIRKCRFQISSF